MPKRSCRSLPASTPVITAQLFKVLPNEIVVLIIGYLVCGDATPCELATFLDRDFSFQCSQSEGKWRHSGLCRWHRHSRKHDQCIHNMGVRSYRDHLEQSKHQVDWAIVNALPTQWRQTAVAKFFSTKLFIVTPRMMSSMRHGRNQRLPMPEDLQMFLTHARNVFVPLGYPQQMAAELITVHHYHAFPNLKFLQFWPSDSEFRDQDLSNTFFATKKGVQRVGKWNVESKTVEADFQTMLADLGLDTDHVKVEMISAELRQQPTFWRYVPMRTQIEHDCLPSLRINATWRRKARQKQEQKKREQAEQEQKMQEHAIMLPPPATT